MLVQVVHQEPDLLWHLQWHLACILTVQEADLQHRLLLVAKSTQGYRETPVSPEGSWQRKPGGGKQQNPGLTWSTSCSAETSEPCPTPSHHPTQQPAGRHEPADDSPQSQQLSEDKMTSPSHRSHHHQRIRA